ncbi:MAG: DnaA [Hyphomicrobiales bacterium]|nr:DnaA [Hyphomicrobiales bacterium]
MVGEGNKLAYAHLTAFPKWPGPLTLVIGPASSGKSHLGRIWSERAGASAAPPGEIEAMAQAGGQVPLLVEDVDRLDYDEAALFHLLNQSMRDRRPLLLTARQAIANWPYRTDDLKSRARLATHVVLASTDDIELSQIFVKLFGDRQVAVDPRIIGYIVPRMERSPEEAVVLAEMMDRLALARGTAINRAVAAEALALRYAQRGGDAQPHPEESDDE